MYSSDCCSQPSHNKSKYRIMLLQYPSVHSFNSLNTASVTCTTVLPLLDEKRCTRIYQAGSVSLEGCCYATDGPPPPPHDRSPETIRSNGRWSPRITHGTGSGSSRTIRGATDGPTLPHDASITSRKLTLVHAYIVESTLLFVHDLGCLHRGMW